MAMQTKKEDGMYPPLVQFETRRAALEAQLARLVELRDRLRAAEESRCSPPAEGSRSASAPAPPRLSETT